MNSYQPSGFSFITALTWLPLAGALVVLLLHRAGRQAARLAAAAFAIAAVAFTGVLWHLFQPAVQGMQLQEWHAWEPSIGLQYHVGLDGLSLVMLAVSSIVVLMAIAASSRINAKQGPLYFALLLFLETGLFGTYTALNFLHWFLYWELSLIPAFFLIRLWGGSGPRPRRNPVFCLHHGRQHHFAALLFGSVTWPAARLTLPNSPPWRRTASWPLRNRTKPALASMGRRPRDACGCSAAPFWASPSRHRWSPSTVGCLPRMPKLRPKPPWC